MLHIALPGSQGRVSVQVNADGRTHLEKWLLLVSLFACRSICKASHYFIPLILFPTILLWGQNYKNKSLKSSEVMVRTLFVLKKWKFLISAWMAISEEVRETKIEIRKSDYLILQSISTFCFCHSLSGIKYLMLILCERQEKCGLWEHSVTSRGVHLMFFPRALI